jgi:hypothetical protein
MAGKAKRPAGDAGRAVRDNVRIARGFMPYAELSRRLGEKGVDIPPLGLRRIEKGARRVDVDELVAFSDVFGIPVIVLLGRSGIRGAK